MPRPRSRRSPRARPGRHQGLPARAHRAPGQRHATLRARLRGLQSSPGGRLTASARGQAQRSSPRARQAVQEDFAEANPAYEEMEGVVAGDSRARRLRLDHRRRQRRLRPETPSVLLKTPAGRTSSSRATTTTSSRPPLFGTEPKFAAKGVKPDLDGEAGRVRRGAARRGLPHRGRKRFATAAELDVSPASGSPTLQDAFTALVVMTPTMSEYFEAWKNSRFIAGDKATEKAFVVASRLQDIAETSSAASALRQRPAEHRLELPTPAEQASLTVGLR